MTNEEALLKFQELMAQRSNGDSSMGEQPSADVVDPSLAPEDTNFSTKKTTQAADQAMLDKNAAEAQGGGELKKAGDLTTTAGAAGGNPYVAGAGLALQTVGMVDQAKRSQEQAKIDAYNRKIMAQRSATHNMFA